MSKDSSGGKGVDKGSYQTLRWIKCVRELTYRHCLARHSVSQEEGYSDEAN